MHEISGQINKAKNKIWTETVDSYDVAVINPHIALKSNIKALELSENPT